jgi:hypothetical protein
MQKELEFLELDDQNKRYRMVQGHVGVTTSYLPGMWSTSTTLQSDVYLAYHYKRKLSESEESSRKLYDLLFAMSSVMGIWGEEDDEDL